VNRSEHQVTRLRGGHGAQRTRQVGLPKNVARPRRHAVWSEDGLRSGEEAQEAGESNLELVALPPVLDRTNAGGLFRWALSIGRWPIVVLVAAVGNIYSVLRVDLLDRKSVV